MRFSRGKLLFAAVPVIGGLGLLGAHWLWYSEEARINRIVAAFENGGARLEDLRRVDDELASVERDALEKNLADYIGHGRLYKVIVGACGSGTSTAVRRSLRANRHDDGGPRGTLYYLCEPLPDFSRSFAENCGYSRAEISLGEAIMVKLGLASPRASDDDFLDHRKFWHMHLTHALCEAAKKYKQRHGYAPMLVIDAADKIAKNDEKLFLDLQDLAKSGADGTCPFQLCFVASAGPVLPLLNSTSARSRQSCVFEVDDISDAEAVHYLMNAYKIPQDTAQELVETVTGGRFALLNQAADAIIRNRTVKYIRDVHYKTTDETIIDLGVPVNNDLFKILVKKKCYDTNEARKLKGMDAEILDELVKKGIIAIHPNLTYTFESRHVETFFASELSSL